MVILMVALTFVIFVVVDLTLRLTLKRIEERKIRKERERALDVGLRLEFADEAKSLKRVEVASPRASPDSWVRSSICGCRSPASS